MDAASSFVIASLQAYDRALERFTFPSLRPLFRTLGNATEAKEQPFALVARKRTKPVGMLLGGLSAAPRPEARIHSVYVAAPFRHNGLATALWARAEEVAAAAGAHRIGVNYIVGKPSIAAVEAILAKRGWSPPELSMLVVTMEYHNAVKASWLRDWKLPASYRIVRCSKLTEAERDELDEQRRTGQWMARDLDPRKFLEHYHEPTSLALLREGCIRGWVINHLMEGKLRFTCSFVHPELQRKGCVLWLYSEAVRRMHKVGLREGIWTIPTHHPAMQAFARRWMRPYSSEFTESRLSWRKLSLPTQD